MNESSIFIETEKSEKVNLENHELVRIEERNSRYIPDSLIFDPLSVEEEKRITLAIYNLKTQIKDLKKKIRRSVDQEDAAVAVMKDDLAFFKKEYQDLREAMILANTRLVRFVAISFSIRLGWASCGRIDTIDLFSEGIIGLRKAVDRFNPHRGFRFSTYAIHCIRQRIQRHAQSNLSILYVPSHIHEKGIKLARLINESLQSPEAKNNESAGSLDKNIAALAEVNKLIHPKRISLDHQIGEDNELLGVEIIADSRLTPEDVAENADLIEKMIATMETLFWALRAKELAVVRKRIGCGGNGRTLREIGPEMGVTYERVRQIEEIAWGKIKARASRLTLEGQAVPYPELLEIVLKQPGENLLKFCRQLYALREEQKII